MIRLTEPKVPNRGKNAWRHLTREEQRMVAEHAKKSGSLRGTGRHFGIESHTVKRAIQVTSARRGRVGK